MCSRSRTSTSNSSTAKTSASSSSPTKKADRSTGREPPEAGEPGRSPDPRRRLGAAGEDTVASWYERAGYVVLDRNWRVREGELDLVVRRGRTIVFCEVKTRRGDAFGAPFEAVTVTKQRRIRTLARRWLADHDTSSGELRFDVASVTFGRDGSPVVDVIEGAF